MTNRELNRIQTNKIGNLLIYNLTINSAQPGVDALREFGLPDERLK